MRSGVVTIDVPDEDVVLARRRDAGRGGLARGRRRAAPARLPAPGLALRQRRARRAGRCREAGPAPPGGADLGARSAAAGPRPDRAGRAGDRRRAGRDRGRSSGPGSASGCVTASAAVTAWDVERLVLDAFPQVWKVKCFPALDLAAGRPPPGALTVVGGPRGRRATPADRPGQAAMFDVLMLRRIEAYLAERASAFARIGVRNPSYERLQLRGQGRLRDHRRQRHAAAAAEARRLAVPRRSGPRRRRWTASAGR